MENKDLGDKKMNGKQELNEGFSGENIAPDFGTDAPKLREEIEIDADGNEKIVQRARNIEGTIGSIPEQDDKKQQEKGLNRGVLTEKETQKTIENKDLNSDITPNRYPNSHPDNHEDRGNIKLDE